MEQIRVHIQKTYYDTQTGRRKNDLPPSIEEMTVSSQQELTSLVEKIAHENHQDRYIASMMGYPIFTERKLIRL